MKKSIVKNYFYNMFYQILTIVVPLITTPYLSRVLGAEKIGIYSYTLSIATYFILIGTLGIAMYGQREIAYIQEKEYERSKTFFEILILRFITLSISLLLFFITFCIKGQYSFYYRILILELLAYMFDISFYFQGLEEFKKTVLRNSLVKIISVVCIFLFVKSSSDLTKYYIIYVLSTFLGNISLWLYLPNYVCKVKLKELNVFKKHLKATLGLFIPQVAVQIYTVLDKTMIGLFISDKSEVGYYEQAQKIIRLLLAIATSLGTVMVPRMANTYANKDDQKIEEYLKRSFSFVLMLAFPLMFGICSVSDRFVPLFYGEGYSKVAIIIRFISPIIISIGLSNVVGAQYLIPTRQQKKYTISVVIGAVVNVIFNGVLIPIFMSIGAAISTVIAETMITGIQFYLVRDRIKLKTVIRIIPNYLIASIIMFITSILIGRARGSNICVIFIQVCISAITYFSILLLLKDKMLYLGIQYVKLKFKREK